jgi:hypothetical protein
VVWFHRRDDDDELDVWYARWSCMVRCGSYRWMCLSCRVRKLAVFCRDEMASGFLEVAHEKWDEDS